MVECMDIAEFLASSTTDLSWQKDFYRWMHAHPELSGWEQETSAKIQEKLAEFDCTIRPSIGGHGVVAIFSNGEGPCVLARADFDALPVKETTGVSFASRRIDTSGESPVPVMHACGHDMHTTALLGVCALLDAHRSQWAGTFIALFQPSEENGAGAEAMVADGLVEKIPRPDVCFAQHIVPGPAGVVMSKPGAVLAACDSIEIRIEGKSAHGSMPHNSIDPTYIAAMIVIRLQGIVGREIAPQDFAIISVGTLESGHSNNTIPGNARIVLNCRMYSNEVRRKLYAAIERVVQAECAASGVTVPPTFRYFAHGPLTENDPHVFARVRANFDHVFGADSRTASQWTASEDFSNIPMAFNSPYLFWTVGATPRDQWEDAEQRGTIESDIPVNHMGSFLPDYAPTVTSATHATVTAVLTYLGHQ
ncbi:carboxypeptidase [Corynebacterium ulcerans]|uniref:amidohydrolase n=1 Tax=Corynebacterium ulcerans TaxID=65058 RepID=UPI000C792644|nr:amidohydrolase [Corynebacterium ulcerans]PLW00569.1 carboxypeptidase [Corynebacterium ulcerans]